MAAITIFTITYIDLVHKRRQIGVERAIGIKSSPVVLSYVIKAWAYALAGIGTGFLLFRYAVTHIVRSHPFHFPNGLVTLATTWGEMNRDLAILLIVASLAALAPALRSMHIRILDAIWGTWRPTVGLGRPVSGWRPGQRPASGRRPAPGRPPGVRGRG